MRPSAVLLGLVLIVASTPSTARGQTDEARVAREAFVAGRTASDEGRWSEALGHFRQAFLLTGSPVARFNEGFVLRALGRFREARVAFDDVVDGEGLDEATLASVRELRADVDARIATLVLTGLSSDRVTVRVDAEDRTDDGTRPLSLSVDPGERALALRREGYEPFDWTGTLSDGQRLDLDVHLVHQPTSVFEEPWLWICVGVAVLVGVAIAIWAYDDSLQLRPDSSHVARF